MEKIKTIGDAYMAAAGLDTGAQIHYADAVANMALEMQGRSHEYRRRSGERIELRIGIGTGPVVAGVIGKKKFIYDMWGDTVNVAFRMAARCPAGAVQVDLMTYRRLQTASCSAGARGGDQGQGADAGLLPAGRMDSPAAAQS